MDAWIPPGYAAPAELDAILERFCYKYIAPTELDIFCSANSESNFAFYQLSRLPNGEEEIPYRHVGVH
jgi:hypothetical protein